MKMSLNINNIIITGKPGIGKTTLIKKLVCDLKLINNIENISGFLTEEIRLNANNQRIGFDLITFDNQRIEFARLRDSNRNNKQTLNFKYFGKYSINVNDFDHFLNNQFNSNASLLIIDEIGKMELLSNEFDKLINTIIDNLNVNNKKILISTIPLTSNLIIINKLKSLNNSKIFIIDYNNRNTIYKEIIGTIKNSLELK